MLVGRASLIAVWISVHMSVLVARCRLIKCEKLCGGWGHLRDRMSMVVKCWYGRLCWRAAVLIVISRVDVSLGAFKTSYLYLMGCRSRNLAVFCVVVLLCCKTMKVGSRPTAPREAKLQACAAPVTQCKVPGTWTHTTSDCVPLR
jgi:hypothetical protein